MSSFDARLGRDGIHSMKLLFGCLQGFRIRSEVIDEDSMLAWRCDKDLVCIRREVEPDRHTYSQHPHYLEQERTCPLAAHCLLESLLSSAHPFLF
jgi:hypothetical protein